jgi:RNA polymerase sigma factor (sigma-70 family)
MCEFNRLVEREIPRLRRYARALTRETSRADDLVQDTLMRAIAKAHLWEDGSDIRAWLFTIMHNQHVNGVRRALREEATIDVEQVASTLVATSDPTASRQIRELERALDHLSECRLGQCGRALGVRVTRCVGSWVWTRRPTRPDVGSQPSHRPLDRE